MSWVLASCKLSAMLSAISAATDKAAWSSTISRPSQTPYWQVPAREPSMTRSDWAAAVCSVYSRQTIGRAQLPLCTGLVYRWKMPSEASQAGHNCNLPNEIIQIDWDGDLRSELPMDWRTRVIDPVEEQQHNFSSVALLNAAAAHSRKMFQNLLNSHIITVSMFLIQPQCNLPSLS